MNKSTSITMRKTSKKLAGAVPMYRPMILSRHPSHRPLRTQLPRLPFRSVVRLGSTTQREDDVTHGGRRIECNTVASIHNSASKFLMKLRFTTANVVTAAWWKLNGRTGNISKVIGIGDNLEPIYSTDPIEFPIIAKHVHGSRGTGNYLLKTQEELDRWRNGKTLANYIFEKFHDYVREYRLHVTKDGCFYTCRKMLKRDAPKDGAWQRHDDNCVWILEDNAQFDKPVNWDLIVADCVTALKAVGLDIGALDVKVQSRVDGKGRIRTSPKWCILETNSAASFGDVTLQKYLTVIPQILRDKKAQ